MDIRDASSSAATAAGAGVLAADEAERLVEALQPMALEDVGTPKWMQQHMVFEKLNAQAHHNAMTNSDPFVLEALLTFDKLSVVVRELITVEAWKEHVFPRCRDRIAELGSLRAYFILYHEATLCNLLEVLFFHRHACEAVSDDLVDVVDYCARKLTLLNSRDESVSPPEYGSATEQLEAEGTLTPAQELDKHFRSIGFRVAVSAVTIVRYLTEHIASLPVSVMTRVLDTHDLLLQFVPLVENPPWTRRTREGKWFKFYDQQWHEVKPEDLLLVTRIEGQCWLALYNILCDTECRRKYHLNTFRKDTILRVRKYMHEVLLDQLPVLSDVQRLLDELSIMDPPAPTQLPGGLILQQVPHIREGLLHRRNWDALARHVVEQVFGSEEARRNEDIKRMADLYYTQPFLEMLGAGGEGEGEGEVPAEAVEALVRELATRQQGEGGGKPAASLEDVE